MNRATWKIFYRQLRIFRREAAKAVIDMAIYGGGFVRISEAGFVNHVLPNHVVVEKEVA